MRLVFYLVAMVAVKDLMALHQRPVTVISGKKYLLVVCRSQS